jgi:glycosyltransferase involved in cell wall biosynthesis
MMADGEDLARLGRQAREWVCRNRSWETQCRPVIELYEQLLDGRRMGGGVLLVAPKPRPAPTGGVETGVALILGSPLLQKHGIDVWDRRLLRRGGSWLGRAAGQFLHFARFAAYLSAHRPRAVRIKASSGINFFQSAIYTWISRGLGRRAVMEFHSGEFEGWYNSRSGIGRWAIRQALRGPSELVALSEYWRNLLARMAPGRPIQVVPNGVEVPELPERRPNGSAMRVLTIATLGAYKGHFDILAAAAQLRDRPIRFLLAGPDETDGRGEGGLIRRWAEVLDLSKTVQFTGPVGPQEKWQLLAEADVFLLPSRAEGMPNAVLEAMAAGLPVVATPVGALPEMLGEGLGARFVPVGDSGPWQKRSSSCSQTRPGGKGWGDGTGLASRRAIASAAWSSFWTRFMPAGSPEKPSLRKPSSACRRFWRRGAFRSENRLFQLRVGPERLDRRGDPARANGEGIGPAGASRAGRRPPSQATESNPRAAAPMAAWLALGGGQSLAVARRRRG